MSQRSKHRKKSKKSQKSFKPKMAMKSKSNLSKRKKRKAAPPQHAYPQIQGLQQYEPNTINPYAKGYQYQPPYDTRQKSAESDTYSIKSAEPFNPYQYFNDIEEKTEYQIEGVNDHQLETMGTLPMKRMKSESSDSDSNSQRMITNTNDDMIADSESSHSFDDTQNNQQMNETMIGMNTNEDITFDESINIEDNSEDIAPKQDAITLIGSDVNEKVIFKSNIAHAVINNENDDNLAKDGAITMIGAEVNEQLVFKKYNEKLKDKDKRNKNIETMMGAMDDNERIEFNINNTEHNEEYEEEGKRQIQKKDVLTDLQNIKNHVINALPETLKYDYDHPQHPKNKKKSVYNYADEMSVMYDKSNAMMKSMDNTYGKEKKNGKNKKRAIKHKKSNSAITFNKIRKQKEKKKKSKSDLLLLRELEPGAMKIKNKRKSNPKRKESKSKGNKKKRADSKSDKSKKVSKKRWDSFFKRNGL